MTLPSSTSPMLAGRRVWLTRPVAQAAELAARLTELGAEVLHLPLLDIRPLAPDSTTRQRLLDLDRYDLVFYVSTNAARIGLDCIAQWWPQYPSHIRNFAVGPGTAAVLEAQGLVAHYPTARMTSEAMLALPELQAISGLKALIVRGVGGREIIAEGLQARGVSVDYAELYERALPAHAPAWLESCLARTPPDAVVISSGEALDNLKTLYAPLTSAWHDLPLLVSSPRLADHARQAGFNRAHIIAGASDAAIVQGLCDWCATVEQA